MILPGKLCYSYLLLGYSIAKLPLNHNTQSLVNPCFPRSDFRNTNQFRTAPLHWDPPLNLSTGICSLPTWYRRTEDWEKAIYYACLINGTLEVLAWDVFLQYQKIKIRKLLETAPDWLELTKGSSSGLRVNVSHYILITILKSPPKVGLIHHFL